MIKLLMVLVILVLPALSASAQQKPIAIAPIQNDPVDPLIEKNYIVPEEVGDKIKKWGIPVGGMTHTVTGEVVRNYYIVQYQALNSSGRLMLRRAVFQNLEKDLKKPGVYILIWLFDGWQGDDKKPKLQWVWDLQRGPLKGEPPPDVIKDKL
jgi:hypothetical protein